jgi:CDGSH-type Zn-finger protein
MTDQHPTIGGSEPIEVTVEAGDTIWWCACGRSATQPQCDGSHAGTEFTPMRYEVEEEGTLWLCTCKRTANPPFCDGSHQDLAAA